MNVIGPNMKAVHNKQFFQSDELKSVNREERIESQTNSNPVGIHNSNIKQKSTHNIVGIINLNCHNSMRSSEAYYNNEIRDPQSEVNFPNMTKLPGTSSIEKNKKCCIMSGRIGIPNAHKPVKSC